MTSQSKIKLCRDGPTYVDHVLSKDRGHNASLDPQLLGLKSSTLPPSHCVPLLFEENAMQFYYPSYQWLCHTGLLVISFAACFFFFFFFFFFVFFFTATYVDPASASSGSRVIRLPPSMWRECNEPMQPPF